MKINMDNIDGIIKCDEKLINHTLSYKFFKKTLESNTILNYDKNKLVIDDDIMYDDICYDYLIDCTYGQAFKQIDPIDYELCISLIYNGDINAALTLMDGPFFSIYPYITSNNKNQYTLTDVEYTPLIKSNNFNEISSFQITDQIITNTKLKMETKVKKYIENFDDLFTYESYNISFKCKFKNGNDDRSVRLYKNKNVYSFVGGKITGIFGMAKILFGELFDEKILEDAYKIIEENYYI
jgi:hypothetical protein